MNQSQQYSSQRIPSAYGAQNDGALTGLSPMPQSSPRDYSSSSAGASSFKHEMTPASSSQIPSTSAVPNVLQPGGMSGRSPSASTTTVPSLPFMQMSPPQPDYPTPTKPQGLGISHGYSRSSPNVDAPSPYHAYTPTTPSSAGPSQFMDMKYSTSHGGSHRIPNAPLGLADIRPRADSSISEGMPGSLAYDLANSQPGVSNYLAPWTAYALDWCKWSPHANSAGKLALGSYLEDGHNFIHILESQVISTPPDALVPGSSRYCLDFTKVAEATHSYPVTRLLWEPQSAQKQTTDLLATSGDHLRLWSLPSDLPSPQTNSISRQARDGRPVTKLTPLALLSNSKTSDHTAPLTSLDWNAVSPSLIITSSIDTTCTIWDIPSLTAKTQLIAHDKEVYDVRFCANSVDVFVSCGQDGSVRMFDLRSLEHSTIIYEPTAKDERDANGGRISPTLAQQTMSNAPPLLRLATSPHDTNILATFAQDSNVIRLLDVRQPGQALLELRGHGGAVNCLEWSPLRRGILASGGDDCQVLIWDLLKDSSTSSGGALSGTGPDAHRTPVASWQCDYEVSNVGWVPQLSNSDYGDWLGVSAGRGVWGARLG